MPEIKDKERILKAAREVQLVTYKGVLIRQPLSQQKLCRPKGNIQSDEKQGPTAKTTLPSKSII